MICCDQYDEWYNGDCVGITPDDELEMKGDNKKYISYFLISSPFFSIISQLHFSYCLGDFD